MPSVGTGCPKRPKLSRSNRMAVSCTEITGRLLPGTAMFPGRMLRVRQVKLVLEAASPMLRVDDPRFHPDNRSHDSCVCSHSFTHGRGLEMASGEAVALPNALTWRVASPS